VLHLPPVLMAYCLIFVIPEALAAQTVPILFAAPFHMKWGTGSDLNILGAATITAETVAALTTTALMTPPQPLVTVAPATCTIPPAEAWTTYRISWTILLVRACLPKAKPHVSIRS